MQEFSLITFGKRVRECREQKQMTQQELATICDLHITTIARIERAELSPTIDVTVRIAKALDVTVDYLCGQNIFNLVLQNDWIDLKVPNISEEDANFVLDTATSLVKYLNQRFPKQ